MDNDPKDIFEKLAEDAGRRAHLSETFARFGSFLQDHGLNLVPSPVPDVDEYIKRILTEPSEDLDLATQRLLLAHFAGRRCFLERNAEATGMTVELFPHTQKTRESIVETLWEHNLWHEPWTSLIDEEFPGEGPTHEDFERFIQNSPDQVLESLELQKRVEERQQQFRTTLSDAGYPLSGEDIFIAEVLAGMHVTAEYVRRGSSAPPERSEAVEVIGRSSQPDHAAWWVLLDRFFPFPKS